MLALFIKQLFLQGIQTVLLFPGSFLEAQPEKQLCQSLAFCFVYKMVNLGCELFLFNQLE